MHGFFYFYFINEHVLRFLGKRYPHDYNEQPGWIYWVGQIAWLLPWSLLSTRSPSRMAYTASVDEPSPSRGRRCAFFRSRTIWLLSLYAGIMLVFFSISTNPEYTPFPPICHCSC